jgi:phosphonoacetaldehyde hydrolase
MSFAVPLRLPQIHSFSNQRFDRDSMEKIRAILFDVIGTTVLENNPDLINRCFQDAFSRNSITIDKAEVLRVRGKDKLEAIQEILITTNNSQNTAVRIFEDFKKNVIADISNFTEHPEFAEVMEFLKNRKIKVGVGSGLPASVFQILFDHLGWSRYKFDYTAVFERFKAGRPDPVMILDMCNRINVPTNQLLKVGDTVSDVLEGKNANVTTAVVMSGTQRKEQLLASKPDHVFNTLREIMSIIN